MRPARAKVLYAVGSLFRFLIKVSKNQLIITLYSMRTKGNCRQNHLYNIFRCCAIEPIAKIAKNKAISLSES